MREGGGHETRASQWAADGMGKVDCCVRSCATINNDDDDNDNNNRS